MLLSQAFEDGHFTKREISSAIVERGTREIVPPCAAFFPYLAMIFRRSATGRTRRGEFGPHVVRPRIAIYHNPVTDLVR